MKTPLETCNFNWSLEVAEVWRGGVESLGHCIHRCLIMFGVFMVTGRDREKEGKERRKRKKRVEIKKKRWEGGGLGRCIHRVLFMFGVSSCYRQTHGNESSGTMHGCIFSIVMGSLLIRLR